MVRLLKPVAAGLALAYVATGFLDGPPPVHFRTENAAPAKQTEIIEPQAELVIERNIMKLGSLLTFQAESPTLLRQGENGEDSSLFFDSNAPAVKGAVTGAPKP